MADHRSVTRRAGLGAAAIAVALAQATTWAETPPAGDAEAGERLFVGTIGFGRGGPACGECHDAAGLPFPHGGSVGPSLTRTYSKYGPEPLRIVLSTLYFPTMQALFADRPLTESERADLTAFFQRAETAPPARPFAPILAATALAGAIALLGIAGLTWRRRLLGVRRSMLAQAKGRPGA